MTLTADPRWWCWHEVDGWRLDLWDGPTLLTLGPYVTEATARTAAPSLGVRWLDEEPPA